MLSSQPAIASCVAKREVSSRTYQAWREIWPIPALWSTTYGQLLLAKVAGFLLIVAVAYFSRQAVQQRLRAAGWAVEDAARPTLVRLLARADEATR